MLDGRNQAQAAHEQGVIQVQEHQRAVRAGAFAMGQAMAFLRAAHPVEFVEGAEQRWQFAGRTLGPALLRADMDGQVAAGHHAPRSAPGAEAHRLAVRAGGLDVQGL